MSETQEEVKPEGLCDPSEVFAKEPEREATIEELIEELPDPLRQVFKISQKTMNAPIVAYRPIMREQKVLIFDWRMCENMQDVLQSHFDQGWFVNMGADSVHQSEPNNKILFILSKERETEMG